MVKLRKLITLMAMAVSMAAMLASCDYWDEDWYKGGKSESTAVAGSSGSSGSSSGSGETAATEATTTVVYTSYDSRNGYLNIDGGQYQTCTLTGNSQGGTITLSDGIKADLTGSYVAMGSTANAAANPVALSMIEISGSIIEGNFTVTFFGGILTSKVLVTKDFLIAKSVASDGATFVYALGKAARNYEGAGGGTGIVPGSAEDPVNGTKWKYIGSLYYAFTDGYLNNGPGPYTVSKTDDGYKICWGFWDNSMGDVAWLTVHYELMIDNFNATEGSFKFVASGWDNIQGSWNNIVDYSPLYKITE
ncbi:MAG: hypothetical protein K6G18_07880 [Treponema sp.]|nr:hypothetical protein [Treponema sp.]